MAFRVLLTQDIAIEGKQLLKENDCEVVVASAEKEDIIIECIKACDAVFSATFFLNERILREAKKLKVIAKHGVGIENVVDLNTATELGKYVVNTPYANMNAVAEHTVAGMLAFSKKVTLMDTATRTLNFNASQSGEIHEVVGLTIGLIGLGNIGRIVARICALGLNMKVVGYDPYQDKKSIPEYIEMVDDMDNVIKCADYLSLHIGLTNETWGLINIDKFVLMKRTAVLLNFARGAIVVEKDLVEALQAGIIAGAILDVYEKEPVEVDNPLLKMDNVLLSPHSAASTDEALARTSYDGAKGIVDILYGRKPEWCLNYNEVSKMSG